MQRKDGDDVSGKPMFPRLHVNDKEKGGPRAPPRNKMALYEQLSIPSQRFNHGVLPVNPSSNGNLVPPAGQGNGPERNMFLPHHLPSPIPRRKMNELSKGANSFSDIECQDHLVANLSRLHESSCRPQSEDNGHVNGAVDELTRYTQKASTHGPGSYSHSGGVNCSEPDDDNEYLGDQRSTLNVDKSDDVSETSMVDSMSGLDISPDDVVGIIGQKRFWKARRSIVNQQRAFAVQVFELHKLIKVQKLIAGSPHLLHDDSAYLGTPSLKVSPVKKLPEYVVKPTMKRKNELVKVNNKMEHSAENAILKASVCEKSSTHPPSQGPYLGNLPPTPGHQWLVPVMTPSEGLVYKPYPGSGFMGASCGGYGPFMAPGYGAPPYNHHGIGFIPGALPVGHSYFLPYGMPVMNTGIPGSAGPVPISHGQISGGGANISMQHQSSCNAPTLNSEATHAAKVRGTASYPSERACGMGMHLNTEGPDLNRLPSIARAVQEPEAVPQVHDSVEKTTRVIRVVPHNPRSATESAARIFQSIQKERKEYDSVHTR